MGYTIGMGEQDTSPHHRPPRATTEESQMNAQQTIRVAEAHAYNGAQMQTSAILCLCDARKCFGRGQFDFAKERALRSLSYSVGVFHADYRKASS